MSTIDEVIQELSRSFQLITDKGATRFQKKKALEAIFDKSKQACNNLGVDDYFVFVSHAVSYLINCLVDSAESNREKTVQILYFYLTTQKINDTANSEIESNLLNGQQNNVVNSTAEIEKSSIGITQKTVSLVLNALNEILGQSTVMESSEEVRHQMLNLVYVLIINQKVSHVVFLNEYCNILYQSLQDSYHEIKKLSSMSLLLLSQKTAGHFHPHSVKFIKPLLQNLSHQHSRVRAETVKTICSVIQYGDNKSVDDVCSHLAQRLFDDAPIVREEVIKTVGFWLLDLPDRYSFHHKLIPLLLTGTFDDITSISENAFSLWYDIGLKYEKENEEELKDKQDFAKAAPNHYPKDQERPNLGCRVLMFRNLSKIIRPLSKDILDWVAGTRTKSAHLLAVLVLNAEECITQHLEVLFSACYKAALDEEALVQQGIRQALLYTGYFVEINIWWKLICPVLQRADTQLRSALFCLAPLIQGSHPAVIQLHLKEMVSILAIYDVCMNYTIQIKMLQIDCVRAILNQVAGDTAQDVCGDLYYILLAVMALQSAQGEDETCQYIVQNVKQELQHMCTVLELPYELLLHRKYFSFVLNKFQFYDDWTKHCPHRVLLDCLCFEAGPVVGENVSTLMPIFKSCLNVSKDVELRLKIFLLLAKLVANASESINSTGEFSDFVPSVISDMIFPNCAWKAGRTAETIRKVAATCLWALVQGMGSDLSSLKAVKLDFLPVFSALLEDDLPDTRLLAVKSFLSILEVCGDSMDHDALHKFYPNILKRLDDPQDPVRSQACLLLRRWFQILRDDFDPSLYAAHFEELFKTLLIHLDDQESSVQKDVLAVLLEAGPMHPVKLKAEIDRVRPKHRSEQLLDQLEQAIMPALLQVQAST